MARQQRHKKPTAARVVRAIASSTAIETGQAIAQIEAQLKARNSKFAKLKLAP